MSNKFSDVNATDERRQLDLREPVAPSQPATTVDEFYETMPGYAELSLGLTIGENLRTVGLGLLAFMRRWWQELAIIATVIIFIITFIILFTRPLPSVHPVSVNDHAAKPKATTQTTTPTAASAANGATAPGSSSTTASNGTSTGSSFGSGSGTTGGNGGTPTPGSGSGGTTGGGSTGSGGSGSGGGITVCVDPQILVNNACVDPQLPLDTNIIQTPSIDILNTLR